MNKFLYRSRNFVLISGILLFLGVLSLFGILWIRSNVIALEYRLSQLEEKKKNLIRQQRILLAEKASLTSIARFEKGDIINLYFPDRKKVVYITEKAPSISKVSFNRRD